MITTAVPQVAVVIVTIALLAAVTDIPALREQFPLDETVVVFALASVALGGMSTMLGGMIGRLTGDRGATWIGTALALYSLVGVPANTIGATVARGNAALGNARLFVHLAVVAALFVAACLPGIRSRWSCRSAFALSLLATFLVAVLGGLFPAQSLAVTTYPAARLAVSAAWVGAGLALAVGGWLRGSRSYSWIGLGCSAIALAHIGRVSGGAPSTPLDLSFASLNLYGTVLVVCGLTRLALHALWALDETQSIQQEELRLAKMDLRRAAEQDHELRNGLAGLAGAAGLLVVRPEESAQLRAAMAAELARLDALLRSSRHGAENVPRAVYSVASILRQQVALRRCAGMDVRLDADPELTAAGTPATLAQVVTNVLANCVEHAPGSPVRVRAARRDGSISIWISDDGPGVPPGTERSVFRAGARGVDSDGQGLGLHISQRLLRVEGGSIEIMPRCREHTGCTVWIQLSDAAPTTDRPGARVLAGRS